MLLNMFKSVIMTLLAYRDKLSRSLCDHQWFPVVATDAIIEVKGGFDAAYVIKDDFIRYVSDMV